MIDRFIRGAFDSKGVAQGVVTNAPGDTAAFGDVVRVGVDSGGNALVGMVSCNGVGLVPTNRIVTAAMLTLHIARVVGNDPLTNPKYHFQADMVGIHGVEQPPG